MSFQKKHHHKLWIVICHYDKQKKWNVFGYRYKNLTSNISKKKMGKDGKEELLKSSKEYKLDSALDKMVEQVTRLENAISIVRLLVIAKN